MSIPVPRFAIPMHSEAVERVKVTSASVTGERSHCAAGRLY